MSRFHELLLSELRVLESQENSKNKNFNKNQLELALIDNENLNALGYQLKEEGIIKLAMDYKVNPNMTPLYKRVMELEPAIEVSPMYPNFPIQVLEMDELEYRIHQIMHYISTYGVEELLGIEVKTGWLPKTEEVMERERDIQVADLKTLDYLSPVNVDKKVIKDLIGRKERLLPKELELAKAVVLRTKLPIENVPFKENIGKIFGDLLLTGDLEQRYITLDALSGVVEHPGDVLDLIEYMVVKNKYKHFKTSVKRGLVKLIEQFPASSIEENLASNRWSSTFRGKGGKTRAINRNIALIDYLSYNRFSQNASAQKIVNELKSGLLLSWNQKLEQAYTERNYDEVVRLLSQRPGVMFRQVNRLVKLGVDANKIATVLKEKAKELKTQTIVSAMNNYEGQDIVDKIFLDTLVCNLNSKDLREVFNGKKVYIDEKDIDFAKSKLEITDKFEEGGYITNGMAIRIPEDAEFLRFFTYWNDDRQIDIDLHGVAVHESGEISHIGWNGRYKDGSLVHSGDITHSNATEYIDLDLKGAEETGVVKVQFNINSYTGVPFNKIDTVFTGLMALSGMGQKVDLFDPKNVIFRHDLENKSMSVDYGIIDLENKLIYIVGKKSDRHNDTNVGELVNPKLTIKTYLGILILTQGGNIVNKEEDADLVLGLAKEDKENYISLIDKNFFMD